MPGNAFERLKSYTEDIFCDKTKLIRIMLIVLILLIALALRIHENGKADITVDSSEAESRSSEICVDIGGAVVNPGVYTVSPDTRLNDVIEMAGGLISNADTDSINRAEYVEDGQKIIIPVRPQSGGTYPDYSDEDGASGEAPEQAEQDSAAEPAASQSSGSSLVNINYASREELMTLSGIGESKADSIIEYRSNTRFRKKEDIKSVNGIGDAIYNKIKDDITV